MYCIARKENPGIDTALSSEGKLELHYTMHSAEQYIKNFIAPNRQGLYTPHPVEVREKRLWGE